MRKILLQVLDGPAFVELQNANVNVMSFEAAKDVLLKRFGRSPDEALAELMSLK